MVTLGLLIGEGLETCFSAALGFQPVWACLDAGNLETLPVLGGIEALTIVADRDEAGIKAAGACGRRWLRAGVEVRIWKAPSEGADMNDFAGAAA
jgi:putative DNA primase/helicase